MEDPNPNCCSYKEKRFGHMERYCGCTDRGKTIERHMKKVNISKPGRGVQKKPTLPAP